MRRLCRVTAPAPPGWPGPPSARRDAVEDHVVREVLFPFQDEIAERRERQARVKEKYGLRSLDYLIQESNQKILDYQIRQAAGEQVDLPLLNEQRNLEELERRREELKEEIRLERSLAIGGLSFLGAAVVVPLVAERETDEVAYEQRKPEAVATAEKRGEYTAGMKRDEQVEAVGTEVAMAYEREQGWHPEDVAAENLGFDVRSTRYDEDGSFAGVRYVEVKARAQSGAIRLSSNEWKKARHFGGRSWLYVVTGAGTVQPELHRIQDPAAHFREGDDIFATGFIVHEDAWRVNADQTAKRPR